MEFTAFTVMTELLHWNNCITMVSMVWQGPSHEAPPSPKKLKKTNEQIIQHAGHGQTRARCTSRKLCGVVRLRGGPHQVRQSTVLTKNHYKGGARRKRPHLPSEIEGS